MTEAAPNRLKQRAQYVADGVAVGIIAVNPDPAHPAARLVLRTLYGAGGPAELQVTARPGDVVDYAGRRFTITAVVAAGEDAEVGHVDFRDEPEGGR